MSTALLEVARTIRPYLQSLLGDKAAAVDRELSTLLEASATGTAVDEQIAEILHRSPATADWAAQMLADAHLRPPELQRVVERSIVPLPGQGEPVGAERYICPVDRNYVWWRRSVGQPIPTCPDHDVSLVRG